LPIIFENGFLPDNFLIKQIKGKESFHIWQCLFTKPIKFRPAGIVIEFNAEEKELILKQGGNNYLFLRE